MRRGLLARTRIPSTCTFVSMPSHLSRMEIPMTGGYACFIDLAQRRDATIVICLNSVFARQESMNPIPLAQPPSPDPSRRKGSSSVQGSLSIFAYVHSWRASGFQLHGNTEPLPEMLPWVSCRKVDGLGNDLLKPVTFYSIQNLAYNLPQKTSLAATFRQALRGQSCDSRPTAPGSTFAEIRYISTCQAESWDL